MLKTFQTKTVGEFVKTLKKRSAALYFLWEKWIDIREGQCRHLKEHPVQLRDSGDPGNYFCSLGRKTVSPPY